MAALKHVDPEIRMAKSPSASDILDVARMIDDVAALRDLVKMMRAMRGHPKLRDDADND